MQAALAAMAAHSVILSTYSSLTLFSQIQTPNTHPTLHSSFHGVSLKVPIKSQSQSLSVAAAPKPLTVVAATKKAVAVLKGTSSVEGVVTLTQEDDGTFLFTIHHFLCML